MGAMTNYLENKLIDWFFRGQAFAPPAALYAGLLTAAPSDSAPGTEVVGGSYARVLITPDLANMSGTQGAGSTTISSGTSGTTFNNVDLSFATPTADWGTVGWCGLYDAPTGGNLLAYCALNTAKSIFTNDIVVIPIASLSFQFDN